MPLHKSYESLRWSTDIEYGMRTHIQQPNVCVYLVWCVTLLAVSIPESWGTDYAARALSCRYTLI